MDQEKPIEWEPLSPGTFNPEFSGYVAAPYFTGCPELGFCLYSRDGRGTWNQRTKVIQMPLGCNAHPVQVKGQWWWSYEFPQKQKGTKMNQPDIRTLEGQLELLDYHAPDADAVKKHAGVNAAVKELWLAIAPLLPDGPGKTRTLHAVNRARMDANGCIANHGA